MENKPQLDESYEQLRLGLDMPLKAKRFPFIFELRTSPNFLVPSPNNSPKLSTEVRGFGEQSVA